MKIKWIDELMNYESKVVVLAVYLGIELMKVIHSVEHRDIVKDILTWEQKMREA